MTGYVTYNLALCVFLTICVSFLFILISVVDVLFWILFGTKEAMNIWKRKDNSEGLISHRKCVLREME